MIPSHPPASYRAPSTFRSLVDRTAAADLDAVQTASMDLHLSHLLRMGGDRTAFEVCLPQASPGIATVEHGEAARS